MKQALSDISTVYYPATALVVSLLLLPIFRMQRNNNKKKNNIQIGNHKKLGVPLLWSTSLATNTGHQSCSNGNPTSNAFNKIDSSRSTSRSIVYPSSYSIATLYQRIINGEHYAPVNVTCHRRSNNSDWLGNWEFHASDCNRKKMVNALIFGHIIYIYIHIFILKLLHITSFVAGYNFLKFKVFCGGHLKHAYLFCAVGHFRPFANIHISKFLQQVTFCLLQKLIFSLVFA